MRLKYGAWQQELTLISCVLIRKKQTDEWFYTVATVMPTVRLLQPGTLLRAHTIEVTCRQLWIKAGTSKDPKDFPILAICEKLQYGPTVVETLPISCPDWLWGYLFYCWAQPEDHMESFSMTPLSSNSPWTGWPGFREGEKCRRVYFYTV